MEMGRSGGTKGRRRTAVPVAKDPIPDAVKKLGDLSKSPGDRFDEETSSPKGGNARPELSTVFTNPLDQPLDVPSDDEQDSVVRGPSQGQGRKLFPRRAQIGSLAQHDRAALAHVQPESQK